MIHSVFPLDSSFCRPGLRIWIQGFRLLPGNVPHADWSTTECIIKKEDTDRDFIEITAPDGRIDRIGRLMWLNGLYVWRVVEDTLEENEG